MQTQEPSEYRFNSKVAIIIGITLLALIIPVAGVVIAVKSIFDAKPQPEETVSAMPLQKALEGIAEKNLKTAPLAEEGDQRVELTSADPVKDSERIEKLAKSYGGVALPASPEGDKLRMLIQIPSGQAQAFLKACQQPELGAESSLTEAPDRSQTPVLVEVVITKTAS